MEVFEITGAAPQPIVVNGVGAVQQIVATGTIATKGERGDRGEPGPIGATPIDTVIGPAGATDNAIARYDGTTGKLIKNSSVLINDAGSVGIGAEPATGFGLDVTTGRSVFRNGSQYLFGLNGSVTKGIRIDPYIEMGVTDLGRLPYFAFNARLTASGTANEFTPAVSDASTRTMSFLRSSAASGDLIFAGYTIAPNTTTPVNLTAFTNHLILKAATGNLGLGASDPTHTLTLPSTSTGIALYNTADQTTNYSRGRLTMSGSEIQLIGESAGTGVLPPVRIRGGDTRIIAIDQLFIQPDTTDHFVQFGVGATRPKTLVQGTHNGSSSIANDIFAIIPTISQSSTAGYTALLVNPTESTVGTGAKLLADFQVGGISKLKIDNTGGITFGGDTNLYRSAADTIKTDDSLVVGGIIDTINSGTQLRFQSGSFVVNSTNGSMVMRSAFTGKTFTLANSAAVNKVVFDLDTGNTTFSGAVTAASFTGSGAGLTDIPQSAVTNLTATLNTKANKSFATALSVALG